MSPKCCRKVSPKAFAYLVVGVTITLCVYYASYTADYWPATKSNNNVERLIRPEQEVDKLSHNNSINNVAEWRNTRRLGETQCSSMLQQRLVDVDTVEVFKHFDFQPSWMKTKEYWDKSFDERYERMKKNRERQPLKVIIVPHSHNDPGWLKTFDNYYHYTSRQIMNNMVTKLQEHKNLTFIWSEIAFLNAWWEEAHPSKKRALKELVQQGRLEIVTAGWVMTDEANTHIYAILDQLIEGHQWLMNNLDVKPKSGWSVDPFGHGSTVPYLLSRSGLKGTVIQRIHYAWKQWLAAKQYGDFFWTPQWSSPDFESPDDYGTILTHNQPFDIYSIKHSCGPHPSICLNFDFRKVTGEYTEYSVKAQEITEKNVREKSELLLDQYRRAASLYPHNVALVPLGDDFRYNVAEEWDQQYMNYMKIIEYVNTHKNRYDNAELRFGTPVDYFREVVERNANLPTLKGDFFVYSDIFSEGRPAYWSGYFTTRPYMKLLDRDLENNLRSAEILFTFAYNRARQFKPAEEVKIIERDFEVLVRARRNLALFQHHDAITGTSKSFVMRDYGLKLFEGIRDAVKVQENALKAILVRDDIQIANRDELILSDTIRETYDKAGKKFIIKLSTNHNKSIVIFNSLAQNQEYVMKLRINTSDFEILDENNKHVPVQLSPVWLEEKPTATTIAASEKEMEAVFIAKLPALSVVVYKVIGGRGNGEHGAKMSTVYCGDGCRLANGTFQTQKIPPGNVQLENRLLKILFDGDSGFLRSISGKKRPRKVTQCAIRFGAYRSAQFHSGAYLFMPDPNEQQIERDVLKDYEHQKIILITSGPVFSELTVIYGAFLTHTVTLFHVEENSALSEAVAIENVVDFETPPKNRETELFMRLITDVQNGDPPVFYSDSNGFQTQKRSKVASINIEGNYFPITTTAFLQDEEMRVTLLTTHAQGAAAYQPGQLEVMLDRRTLYDDSRGMGEGVVDNRPTTQKFWLIVEDIIKNSDYSTSRNVHNQIGDVLRNFIPLSKNGKEKSWTSTASQMSSRYATPSLRSNRLSNMLLYPAPIYLVDSSHNHPAPIDNNLLRFVDGPFGDDVHLLNLRTQSDRDYSQFPSRNAFFILHRQGYDESIKDNDGYNANNNNNEYRSCGGVSTINYIRVDKMESLTLTGIEKQHASKNITFPEIRISPMDLQTFNITFH